MFPCGNIVTVIDQECETHSSSYLKIKKKGTISTHLIVLSSSFSLFDLYNNAFVQTLGSNGVCIINCSILYIILHIY